MTESKEIHNFRKHGGGHPSAVFFWPVWLLGLAVTAWLGGALLRPGDALLPSVPRAAFAYVHGNGDVLPDGMIFDVPPALRPDETGIFWIYRDETAAERSILLRWKFGPTAAERDTLQKLGAMSVDGRIFAFVPSEAAAQDIRRARWGGAGLGLDASVRRALAYVRALMPAQAYIDPVAVLNAPQPLADLLKKAEPTVIGLDTRRGLRAFAVPLHAAARMSTLLARLPKPSGERQLSDIRLPDASLEMRLPATAIDPLAFVAGSLDRNSDLARLIQLPQKAFRAAVRGDFAASISIRDGQIGKYVAYFPGVSVRDLTETVSSYLSTRYPAKRASALPDGTGYTELVAEKSGFRFQSQPDGRLTVRIADASMDLSVWKDKGGVSISNAPDTGANLKQGTNKAKTRTDCLSLTRNFGLSYLKASVTGDKMNLTTWFPQISSMEAVEIVDNFIYFCGYLGVNVDKSVD